MSKFSVLFVLFLISSVAIAGDYGKGIMEPLDEEKLSEPINLTDSCSKIQVIEWRYTKGYKKATSISNDGIVILNETCNLAVNKFYSFIDSIGGYHISDEVKSTKFDTSLSFMPADMERHGDDPRNLNDLDYRFVNRALQIPLWGYFHRASDWAFIRNDVFLDDGEVKNPMFVTVTAHELFHAMSYATGVFNQHTPQSDREDIDEELAQKFTEYLGLGR